MYKKHRWLGVLIAITMMIGLIPAAVFAQEPAPAYAYIPNMGDASVSKVDLSAATPAVVARYFTAPRLDETGGWGDLFGSSAGDMTAIAPVGWRTSRIAIDADGNAWAINTGADALSSITTVQGSIARIQYDVSGMTVTSTSAADIETFGTDEAVMVFAVGDRGDCPRSINIDAAGNLWIGFHKANEKYGYFQKYTFNGTTLATAGARIYGSAPFVEGDDNPVPAFDIAPYNADIDANGVLWFVSYGSSRVFRNGDSTPLTGSTNGVYSFDTNDPIGTFTRHSESNPTGGDMGYMKSGYGIIVDDSNPEQVIVYVTIMDTTGGSVVGLYKKIGDADFVKINLSLSNPRGMAFDNNGVLWIANSGNGSVSSYNPDGGATANYGGFDRTPVGIGKDPLGRMWVVVRDSNKLVGFDPATPNVRISILSGFNLPYAYGDFTQPPPLFYDICGYKFDADTDEGLEGWTINLFKWDATLNGAGGWTAATPPTAITDENGKYCFEDLSAGNYKVTENTGDPDHWLLTSPANNEHLVTLPDGASDCDAMPTAEGAFFYNFQNAKLYELFGFKYNDDTGEPMQGWKIILEMEVGPDVWDKVDETMTDTLGRYEFTRLRAGTYRVSEETRDGWEQVLPSEYHYVVLPLDPMIYGIERTATRPILVIDPIDGSYTELFATNINGHSMNGPNGLAYDSGNDVLYYVTYPYSASLGYADLYRYKIGEATATKIYDLDQELACADFYQGKYYYIAGGPTIGATDDLYEVVFDGAGNVADVVAHLDITGGRYAWTFSGDIAISPDGILYGVGLDKTTGKQQFFSVHRDGTNFTLIDANIVMPLQLAFGSDGVLYANNLSNNSFYTIDLANGDTAFSAASMSAAAFNDMASGLKYYDFRNRTVSNICGYKYRAGTTEGLEGWTINLFKWDKTLNDGAGGWPVKPFATTKTGADGMYCFEGLYIGQYRVEEVIGDPDHWVQKFPKDGYHMIPLPAGDSPDCIELNASERIMAVGRFYNFENEELYDICGVKYDGDTKETLAGITITLEEETEPGVWEFVTSFMTLEDGKYCFEGLHAGTYRVSEALPVGDPNWIQVEPGGDGYHHVTLPGDQSDCEDEETFFNFINRAVGKIHAFKYYDLNANGIYDDGDTPIKGWKIQLYNSDGDLIRTKVTGADGKVTFSPLFMGDYTVKEVMPIEACWMAMTPMSVALTVSKGSSDTAEFGNLCLGYGGGLTLGFWSNKNGQALIGADDLALLRSLNLRNAVGANFDPTVYKDFRTWILSANANNMAYMLSAQLAAMKLNVFNGKVNGNALIYSPTLGFKTVNEFMVMANDALGANGLTIAASADRTYQEALKNVLDRANNNLNFVQAAGTCKISYPPDYYHWAPGYPYGATNDTYAVATVTGTGMDVWWYSDGSLIASGWYHDIYRITTAVGYISGTIANWNEPVKMLFGDYFPELTVAWYKRAPVDEASVPMPNLKSMLIG